MKQEKEIIEGNKILDGNITISLFMNNGMGSPLWVSDGMGGKISYDNSWDWLMPCVEKIESLGFYTKSEGWTNFQYFFIERNDSQPKQSGSDFIEIAKGMDNKKIKAAWKAVVDFIKFYNSQSPKP